ncbi:hypothetical protein C8034_v003982 [Colletotrichum sidae]|uniref:Uncharacterized protein n=3 Tax=Colletotrichum orbiculare species complex TaxID=2707354 RepID=N4VFY2_COLOR|nr:hypothetical protein Cob_v006069 [Colletotrichum orbiculare MAFF 240422]TDZ34171.1 hypothetical protein C8035_v009544 [Colletotrichum spinosum]TEA13934.1 hypothetical protein C8034_v003982 [Colletotrichum sidae]
MRNAFPIVVASFLAVSHAAPLPTTPASPAPADGQDGAAHTLTPASGYRYGYHNNDTSPRGQELKRRFRLWVLDLLFPEDRMALWRMLEKAYPGYPDEFPRDDKGVPCGTKTCVQESPPWRIDF